MNGLLLRGRAWAPVVKSAALFLLPLPLLLAAIASLVAGDLGRLALAGSGLGCFWGAGVLSWRALVAEARYFLGERADPPVVPLKLVSAVLTAIGAALAALAGGHRVAAALVFAAIGGAGYFAFYGRDQRPRRVSVAVVPGVDRAMVTRQLEQAYGRLRGIEAAAREIAVPEFGERLERITRIGRGILGEIERDPRDALRARRFLNIYLDSAERVTLEYARTHRHVRSRPIEDNFRQLLVDMEHTFAEQHRKLLANDVLSLDVEIEVLNARLKREGVS
jgi:5-bromo-4-chloroindolyl phosphate hydrolysis protein